MKYLKLDPWHSECWGLARALYGSPITWVGNHISDYGVLTYVCELLHGFQTSDLDVHTEPILIPLESIKLCPYVAMREGVKLKSTINSWGGIIHKISVDDNGLNEFIHMTNSYTIHSRSDIALDLGNLPKGAEVVEL